MIAAPPITEMQACWFMLLAFAAGFLIAWALAAGRHLPGVPYRSRFPELLKRWAGNLNQEKPPPSRWDIKVTHGGKLSDHLAQLRASGRLAPWPPEVDLAHGEALDAQGARVGCERYPAEADASYRRRVRGAWL